MINQFDGAQLVIRSNELAELANKITRSAQVFTGNKELPPPAVISTLLRDINTDIARLDVEITSARYQVEHLLTVMRLRG